MLVTLTAVRHRLIATGLGAAALAVGALAFAPVPPPVEVERVEPTTPGLVVLPAVTDAEPDDDGWVLVEHRIVNGTSDELRLELDVQAIDEESGTPAAGRDPDVEVNLTADELQLAPSEAARIASVARGVEAGAAYAVVVEVVGADPPVTVTSAVLATAGPVEVEVGAVHLAEDRLQVPLGVTDGPSLVDAAVRLRTWYGHTVLESRHADLVAWGEDRPVELTYDLEDIHVPGPYYVEVVASGGTGEVRAAVTRWLLPETAVYALGALAVGLSLLAVGIVGVRRRRQNTREGP